MESLGTGAREGVQTFKVIKKKPGEEISSCQALIYRVNCQWNSLDRGAIIHRFRRA